MGNNMIRKIFAADIEQALKSAREDERAETLKEAAKDKEDAINRVSGELSLKIKEAESKLASMARRLQMAEERVTATEKQRQEMRELAVTQRQIMSDVVHVMKDWRDRRAEEIQPFTRIETMAIDVETKLMKLSD
jgi:chromosome segregation ATPase